MIRNIDHENVIHYGSDSLIIKSPAPVNGKAVCTKVLNEEFPSPELLAQLDNEFEICSKSVNGSIRKAIKKIKTEEHQALELEYIEGTDLKNFLATGKPDFALQLELSVKIANALLGLQKENIFHRQLNPSNILLSNKNQDVYIIDFGWAIHGNIIDKKQYHYDEQQIEKLQFIAPEQTGRINRPIDNRADLYSSGVILYQMFTGSLPFESNDSLELIHSHVARMPESPERLNHNLPPVITQIIMKLLSKNAEDRYQSAFGVHQDLKTCLLQFKEKGEIESFALGQSDFSGKLFLPGKLFGREKETQWLHEMFDNCADGQKKTLLISGYSGSGKTSLVETLQAPASAKGGFFIKGKFDQISSDTPYSTFAQAFSELIQLIKVTDDAYQAHWRKRILESMGNSVKILTEFIPGIEDITGKLPEVPLLKGIEAQNRFNYEFLRFIKSTADKEHPLILFVDDLQWADASSLNLFKLIAEGRDIDYVFLIGAYRVNEVSETHPLTRKLSDMRDERVPYEEMEVKDLSLADVQHLLAGTLVSKQDNIGFLADIIFNKTQGNAFYVRQFLRSVYDEGLLWFDFDTLHWKWNTDLIMEINVSGNVVELMTSYLQKLPPETLSLLTTAATIGNRFDKRTLMIVSGLDETKVNNLFNIAVSEGLLISAGREFKFAHDRIQQAVYSFLPGVERSAMHLSNGRKLSGYYSKEEKQEKIFEVVNQWNLGTDQISDEQEKRMLAKLNQQAGQKAMASAAYPQAAHYFEKGISLLPSTDWSTHYDFIFQMNCDAAEAAYYSAQYNKVDKLVGNVIKHSRSLLDATRGYEIEIKKLIAQNKLVEAVKEGLPLLQKLGIRLPLKPGNLSVIIGLVRTKWILRNKTINYFNELPEMTDKEKKAAMRIMAEISTAAYFALPNLVPLLVFKMVNYSVKYGLSHKSPFSFAAYGFLISAYMNEIEKGSRMGEIAMHLAKKINAGEVTGSIEATRNLFLDHWKKSPLELKPELEKAYKLSIEYGDNEWASYAAHNIVYHLFVSGERLDALAKKAEVMDLQIEKFKQDLTLKRLRLFRQAIENLIVEKENPEVLTGKCYDESQMDIVYVSKGNEIYFQNLYILKLYLALVFNNTEAAKKFAEVAERFQESVRGTSLKSLLYFYRSLTLADAHSGSTQRRTIIKQIRKDIRQLKKIEKISPLYNRHKTLLLQAEIYYLEGDLEKAKIFYDKALTAATENNMQNDLALCWERAGQFFKNTRQHLLANFYFQNAYLAYKRWGADAKLKQLIRQYPEIRPGTSAGDSSSTLSDVIIAKSGNLDLETVIRASAALSGEIKLPGLLRKMMQIIIENAGASKGFLIMDRGGDKFIEAESGENKDIRVLQSVPVKQSGLLAESVINYVYRTGEMVIQEDAAKSQLFRNDPFIEKYSCKSLLCFPLVNMGRILAVIYLSNDHTFAAFTEPRVELLRLLAGQMAISIENALFYSELENKVDERTRELVREKKKSDDLLLNILPEEVAAELKQTGRTTPRSYDVATVMFTDFENFTVKSEKLSPEELVNIIDSCFKKFDEIISRYNIEKIKTIGDAYLCVSGLPDAKDHNAENVVKAALEIIDVIKSFRQNQDEYRYFNIRIGIHTGPLIAGVVGDKKFAYDIWGDTVNTAARMEQNSEANRVNISQTTYELVNKRFNCIFRGKQPAKNKGMIDMYFVEGEKS